MARKLYDILWLGAPVAMWFAYQPLIRLGQDGTMYYELSIAMLYLAVMAFASLPAVWRKRRELVRLPAVWVVGVLMLVSLASLLWTINLTRGVLTAGVTGMLFTVFLGAMAERGRLCQLMLKIIRVYLYSALAMCGVALVQFFAGLWLGASTTLLCAGCVAEQFGFVRPNAFLIEPQFLGNALLPAALLLTHRVIRGSRDWRLWVALALVVMVLVLTLSRGALLAFAAGVVVLAVLYWRYARRWMMVAGVFMASVAGALGLQGLAVVMNPAVDETFTAAVTKSIHQLTMGVVDVRPSEPSESQQEAAEIAQEEAKESNFDGYVEESTSARTTRTSLALQRWRADVGTVMFGVGIGSAGLAIHEMFPEQLGAREIVQNEYVEILLERGLIGLVSFLAVLAGLFVAARKQSWLWAIIAAFMVQWLFFSGYPNALHVYLTLILISAATLRRDPSAPATLYS